MANYLYLHVPFCRKICSYCDFNRVIYQDNLIDKWLLKIHDDLNGQVKNKKLKTIYLGGGTPTALTYDQLESLLQFLKPYTKELEEYTIESNLESLDEKKLELLKKYGINRVSLGIQSYDNSLLKIMNREHQEKDINSVIEKIVSAGIENISIDLIYGFKEQSIEIWEETLMKAVSNPYIKHISIYSLTVEENSVLGKKDYEMVSNELEAQMYELGINILTSHGFKQYEIANFARAGFESKHNQAYWRYDDFYGVGVGASGKLNHYRFDQKDSLTNYLSNKSNSDIYKLSLKDEIEEYVMMNLRLNKGLDLKHFEELFNYNFLDYFKKTIEKLEKNQAIKINGNYLQVNDKARFYLHDVIIEFLGELDEKE